MSKWRAIILAGGTGSRLFPITSSVSKQLLPVYDKPMIYYPLSILMQCGIREIAIVTTPDQQSSFKKVLSNGSQLGIKLSYFVQDEPKGIAQALIICENFIREHNTCLILGDNIFIGNSICDILKNAMTHSQGASVFAYRVPNPSRFGVVSFNENNQAVEIVEKPLHPVSDYAVTGLYCYDQQVSEIAKQLNPSKRGEIEITDVNNVYLQKGNLFVQRLPETIAWFDAGTYDDLLEVNKYVKDKQLQTHQKIACIEEIAWRKHFINKEKILDLVSHYKQCPYVDYLNDIVQNTLNTDTPIDDY